MKNHTFLLIDFFFNGEQVLLDNPVQEKRINVLNHMSFGKKCDETILNLVDMQIESINLFLN